MLRKLFLLPILLLVAFAVQAAHITGGDFTVKSLGDNMFEATLTLYRDWCSFGANFDSSVEITIFDAVTDEITGSFTFQGFEVDTAVLGNSCFTPDVCLEIGTYVQTFELPDNPNGYYLSKERCCRNDLSINLEGVDLGFVFTVDVPDPALENSSPEFNDYPNEAFFCVNGFNTIDFSASDADGDSLVYSLTDPLVGSSSAFDPNPIVATPKPYQTANWAVGYSVTNQIGGATQMNLDPITGVLTGQPSDIGVFTIAVLVEEYRAGMKIGQIRRELQLSSAVCAIDLPSIIETPNGDTVFDVLANGTLCLELTATDPNEGDTLLFQAESALLDGTVLPMATFTDAEGFSSVTETFCWSPLCQNVSDEPYVVSLTAFSRGCAQQTLVTTQNIYINVILEQDEETQLTGPVPEAVIDLYNPSTHCFEFTFEDLNETDSLYVTSTSEIFELPNADSLTFTLDQGSVSMPYCWDVRCADVRDEPYFVNFQVIATNCETLDTTFFQVPVNVIVPPNEPTIMAQPPMEITWEYYSADTFCTPVLVSDANFFDTLRVTAVSELFAPPVTGVSWEELEGTSLVENEFCWLPECSAVREEPYRLTFMVTSQSCKTNDTLIYPVDISLVLPPENEAQFTLPAEGTTLTHNIGEELIEILVSGTDSDIYDQLVLTAESPLFETQASVPVFEAVGNVSAVFGTFSWQPSCSDVSPEPYPLTFFLRSTGCQKDEVISRMVNLLITTPSLGDITPIPNVITPNGDGLNDTWRLETANDPCLLNFTTSVFDRWGKEVYTVDFPDFEWDATSPDGQQVSTGSYYQVIEYEYDEKSVKHSGVIQVIR